MLAKLIGSRESAPGVRHFEFEALGVEQLEFVPGQFTSFTDVIEGKEITRAYSLASAPSGTNRFELCLNRVEDGLVSPRLFALEPGEHVDVQEPLGYFTLRHQERPAVFVATGTGMVAAELLARCDCTVVGIDQSPEMLAAARARIARSPALRPWSGSTTPAARRSKRIAKQSK